MELFYIQLPCVSRPVSESGGPTEAGPLTATGMGWVAPATSLNGPPICRSTPCPGHKVDKCEANGVTHGSRDLSEST